ncbi:MAG: BamA/TamA family outer membrane protein [Xanthomonadales bacterium]|nr:BamA/TamA family outer membrane protein [Gammaproteobacteria bacterium]MBT8052366.1 BamA/TamA family outer membrane protein [Gammaproteobacteria bacterium]NND56524.1 BamA/TamA family outer membrane protein [Xanthomonadales bacterium]NNK52577.1 BamA/TamA family outer membrane protein [Xanthomonadales bacterium]
MAKPFVHTALRPILIPLLALVLGLQVFPVCADQLVILVEGVEGPLLSNVEARTQSFQISGNSQLSRKRLAQHQANAERRGAVALRPFGYYHPVIKSTLRAAGEKSWEITLQIEKGPPVIVSGYRVAVIGPGKSDKSLREWQANWPLTTGLVLNQLTWEEQKTLALELAEAHGYLGASFSEQVIGLDLERNTAELELTLETGEQAVMGSIIYNQQIVENEVLEYIPRFRPGQPYNDWLMEQFRLDLWRTGYFENIEVVEERRLEESPPLVNLSVRLEPRKRNTYQGSLGFGSDTGFRFSATWNRNLLSSRGDSLDVGIGWQEQNNERSLRTSYRQPRKVSARQFWTAEFLIRTENQKLTVSPDQNPDELITIARGNVDDLSLKPGWLRVRSLKRGFQQIFEEWYVRYLDERTNFDPTESAPVDYIGLYGSEDAPLDLFDPSRSISLGVSWDWPVVRGNGFETVGQVHKAWIFTSNKAWGSDVDFSQIYVSSRWNRIFRKDWKILLRGEVGFSDARVFDRSVETDSGIIDLSITELPFANRFKAGGSQSVRGYGFEKLSNNSIGSNNILTASIEIEKRFRPEWSAAVFIDVGNAFNNWGSMKLKKGAGFGIRWYSIAGAIRVDLAQAFDEPGKPWQLHFTIGSPLL